MFHFSRFNSDLSELIPDYSTRTQVAINSSYTMPTDGFVEFRFACKTVPSSANGVGLYGKINGGTASEYVYSAGNKAIPQQTPSGLFPVKEGDVISCETTDTTNFEVRAFTYTP